MKLMIDCILVCDLHALIDNLFKSLKFWERFVQHASGGWHHCFPSSVMLLMCCFWAAQNHSLNQCLGSWWELTELDLSTRGVIDQWIHKVFIDPSRHSLATICSSVSADTYYIHGKWKKPRVISRLKGMTVSSVAVIVNKSMKAWMMTFSPYYPFPDFDVTHLIQTPSRTLNSKVSD